MSNLMVSSKGNRKLGRYLTMGEPLVIKRRGEDGNRVITVRIREEILSELERLVSETNYSRNELINIILSHGVRNIKIE